LPETTSLTIEPFQVTRVYVTIAFFSCGCWPTREGFKVESKERKSKDRKADPEKSVDGTEGNEGGAAQAQGGANPDRRKAP
jgi:hypothetical protein